MSSTDSAGADERVLAVFLTFGVALSDWVDGGIVKRELALYDALYGEFDEIQLYTYGRNDDRHADALPDHVTIVPKSRVDNDVLYSLLAPAIHCRRLASADVAKTNQMKGSWTAVVAKFFCRTTLVVRTGYVLSIFARRNRGRSVRYAVATLVEFVAYRAADGVITSSPHGREYVEESYRPPGVHRYVPNFIETDVFRPLDRGPDEGTLCTVGRLVEQKNFGTLIAALEGTGYSLTIVGEGPLRDELKHRADDCGVDVAFAGRVPNHDLPELLNDHALFVLPSLYEGMPKVLLEAMSCGRPVVATAVQGNEDIVTHGEDGYLADPTPESLGDAVATLMDDPDLRAKLGRNARERILADFSLDAVVAAERDLYAALES